MNKKNQNKMMIKKKNKSNKSPYKRVSLISEINLESIGIFLDPVKVAYIFKGS